MGAVTTTELTHATPAATYAHICHRDAAPPPSPSRRCRATPVSTRRWGRGRRADGGGANHWTPVQQCQQQGSRADGRDLTAELTAQGYHYVTTKDDLAKMRGGKVLGLFGASPTSTTSWTASPGAASAQPSLSEMTARRSICSARTTRATS